MVDSPKMRRAREEVLAAPADRWGCIRVRRQDVLDLLTVIAAQDEALLIAARNLKQDPPKRFADRIGISLTPAVRPNRRI